MDKIEVLLDDVILSTLDDISSLPVGSEERANAIEDLNDLYKVKDGYKKDKTNRMDILTRLGETLLYLVCYKWMFAKGLKFEETGTIASTTMRNLMSKVRIRK